MDTVDVRMPEELTTQLDVLVNNGAFPNRSEAVRYYVRAGIKREAIDA